MDRFDFSGLGTRWYVVGDLKDDVKKVIIKYIETFEKKFSRFILSSESNSFKDVGEYTVSEEFAKLLSIADNLRTLTNEVYDPAVGKLLESAGYGLKNQENVEDFVLPKWSLEERLLTIDGPVVFDFGGIGKGYCIDQIANILKEFGYSNFLINGGGDIFATTKKDGSSWKVAIEYPDRPDTALGTIELKNQGVAVSDSYRRSWGKWHHLVNPQSKKTIEDVVGGVAVSNCALNADCMTSAIFFSTDYSLASEKYKSQYLVLQSDGSVKVSGKWIGELF